MVTFPVSEFFENSGNVANEFREQLRDGIVGFQCSIWSNFPDFITRGKAPLTSYIRGYMNSVCNGQTPPVPEAAIPFTGGQCTDTEYGVRGTFKTGNTGGGLACEEELTWEIGFGTFGGINGAIRRLSYINPSGTRALFLVREMTPGNLDYLPVGRPGVGLQMPVVDECDDYSGSNALGWVLFGTAKIDEVVVISGTDNCGDPPPEYNTPDPRPEDLNTTININIFGGGTYDVDLQYNEIINNIGFPNGILVNNNQFIFDLDGLNAAPEPNIKSPFSGQEPPAPSSKNLTNGLGETINAESPAETFFKFPEIAQPSAEETELSYSLCNDGVIETITQVVDVATTFAPPLEAILATIINIIEEVCDLGELEALVGLPEYYDARPQAGRPVIVYTYKEVINNEPQRSTYSSTVSNPSAAAIAAIGSLVVQDRISGTFLKRITLLNGARIIASGFDEAAAQTHFDFLLSQVEPSLIPGSVPSETTTIITPGIAVKTLRCRFIDYYPNGRKDNVNPSIRQEIQI